MTDCACDVHPDSQFVIAVLFNKFSGRHRPTHYKCTLLLLFILLLLLLLATQTPSTGLRHSSLEEGAGKRCSECGSNGLLLHMYVLTLNEKVVARGRKK